MKPIIQVLGPTGVGKSRIAIRLARAFGGEIISADSMQVYRHFDIGTDKIQPPDMQGIPHYLIDTLSDCSQFNASMFLEQSFAIAEAIVQRGKIPIVCGGTALYLRVMIRGIFPESSEKRVTRDTLNRIVERRGLECLWKKLNAIDPEYGRKIGKNDRVRIVRAMEIFYNNNRVPPSEAFRGTCSPFHDYNFIRLGLTMDRENLYRRIETRVDQMIARGLAEEVKGLRERYPDTCPPFKSLGYKEMLMHLNGEITDLDETVRLIKQHSRNFAKRQLSWFRQENDIHWFDPEKYDEIEQFMNRSLHA
ncbi:MAG: tRNA (adenosine(37)-N6)-dimethylallyltransferase MiaA [Candidatus Omnitrophota bacterium]